LSNKYQSKILFHVAIMKTQHCHLAT